MLTDVVSTALLVAGLTYLGWRSWEQWRRQRLSYERLPFARQDFRLPVGDEALDRALGAVLGIALGDALGAPRESLPPALCRLRYGPEPVLSRGVFRWMRRRGTVTDDTQHTWLVARATTAQGFDEGAFMESLRDWWGWRIGSGKATDAAVAGLRGRGTGALEGSQGNGAAMRVAPLVVALRHDPEALVDAVRRSARVTHPNREAVAGAISIARLTAAMLGDVPIGSSLAELAHPGDETGQPEEWRTRLREAVQGDVKLGGPGWIFATVPQALWLLVRFGRDWEPGLRAAFGAGGDVDTVAALYLSLVGARWGSSVFPTEVLCRVQGVEPLACEVSRLMDG